MAELRRIEFTDVSGPSIPHGVTVDRGQSIMVYD
jgi:hypothetical protein